MNVNLEYYKIFYYVSKYGGITAAAEKLCISQPAVSQAIKQLENCLGSSLFIRTSKGVKLTIEGESLYSYVQRGYETILLGEEKFRKMIDLESGEIRIGASDMTLQYCLLPYLERFHERYPNIKVSVSNAPTPETITYLKEGKIDFGCVSSPISVKADMKVVEIQQIEDIFVAGNKFWEYKNKLLRYSELERLPIICLEHNTSTRRYIDEFLGQNQVVLKPEFELATSDIIVQFAIRNLGIGCIVSDFVGKYIDSGELFQLHFDKPVPKRNICIITSEKNPISSAARKLLNMIRGDWMES
jgi:DNA-binding transcriptional LysR family regulator